MREKLKNPPLIEALCEFRFVPSSPWDWTIPGRLFDKIGEEFSARSQIRGLGVQVQKGQGTVYSEPELVQLKRPDGSAMVQVGPNLLAINHLRPYPQWETFRDLILRIFNAYCDITQTNSLSRIGLRYINQIPLPKGLVELGDFITLKPPLAGPLDRTLIGFYQRYELAQDVPPGMLIHQTGGQEIDGHPVIFIDLDFNSPAIALQAPQTVGVWLDSAHERVEEAFVASLNPALYEKMKQGES